MSKVDNARAEEINKAITERNAINRQLIQAKTQLNQQTTIRRKSELTHEELKNLPEETIVYRAIGTFSSSCMATFDWLKIMIL